MRADVSRVPLIGALLLGVLCLPVSVSAQQRSPIADQIARTYGVDSWGQVEAIRFPFNLDMPQLSRSLVWELGPLLFSLAKRGTADGKPIHDHLDRREVSCSPPTWNTTQSMRHRVEPTPGFEPGTY